MNNDEIEKATLHHIGEIVEYEPNSVKAKSLLKKPTGNVSVLALDEGAGIRWESHPFETFLLLLEGEAEIVIDEKANQFTTFRGIIIPPHSSYVLKAIAPSKVLSVTIKSGYEE